MVMKNNLGSIIKLDTWCELTAIPAIGDVCQNYNVEYEYSFHHLFLFFNTQEYGAYIYKLYIYCFFFNLFGFVLIIKTNSEKILGIKNHLSFLFLIVNLYYDVSSFRSEPAFKITLSDNRNESLEKSW